MKEATLEVEESTSQHATNKEECEEEVGGGEEQSTPFRLQNWTRETTSRFRKKQKSGKHAHVDPMVLTEGDLDEIRDKVRDKTTELWTQFEQQYMQMLGSMQKDLHEL